MVKRAVPDRGDLVWLEFEPQAGHEQAGRRPALVLSPRAYNDRVGLLLACPVTTHIKGYPFEVLLPADGSITGAVLSDQIKNLDWRARRAKIIATVPAAVLDEVLAKVATLLGS
jgi:mRNA interferase MazF